MRRFASFSAALVCAAFPLSAQTIAPTTAASSASGEDKAPVQLSPFEVVEDTKGYFAANTIG